MKLPEGYGLDRTDPDVRTLVGPDGQVVARFVAGAPDEEVERAASEHQRRGASLLEPILSRLINRVTSPQVSSTAATGGTLTYVSLIAAAGAAREPFEAIKGVSAT